MLHVLTTFFCLKTQPSHDSFQFFLRTTNVGIFSFHNETKLRILYLCSVIANAQYFIRKYTSQDVFVLVCRSFAFFEMLEMRQIFSFIHLVELCFY